MHELRNRIFGVALLFIVSSAVAYQFRDILVHLVLSPLGDQKLIYLTPAGGFSFIFQITMYAGAVITAPFLVFQLYKFVTPALPARARRHAGRIFLTALLLMVVGVLFGYFVAVPAALHFLTTFAGGYVDASLTADSYLGFIMAYVVGLGILFQIPLLLIFWHWIKPLTPKQLVGSERFMVVFSLIAAAIITPTPDVLNQMLIAGPILVVYQIGVFTVLSMIMGERKRTRRAQKAGAGVDRVAVAGREIPSLALPSLEELALERRRTLQAVNAQNPVAAASIAKKPIPIAPVPAKPTVATYRRPMPLRPIQRPTLSPVRGGGSQVRTAYSSIVDRPSVTPRRPQVMSLDGFVVSQ